MDLIGATLAGQYEVVEIVGQGGFGTVYRARQLSVDRTVAVKVLSSAASHEKAVVARFESEARIIARLSHPNALKLIDYGRTDDACLFIVTEFLEGSPLDEVLESRGALPTEEVLRILEQVSQALEEAHDVGVVHRDLKPANIFLQRVGRRTVVKVLDFGIAKVMEGASLTTTGELFGTPTYMSPEQVVGDTKLDGRSDLYSLGVVAFECLTGCPPFQANTQYALLLKHADARPPRLHEVEPHLQDPELDALVAALLAKDPDDRPASAAVLVEQLQRLQARPTARAASVATAAGEDAASARSGRYGRALALGVSGAIAAGAIGIYWWSVDESRATAPTPKPSTSAGFPTPLIDARAQAGTGGVDAGRAPDGSATAALKPGPEPGPPPDAPVARVVARPQKARRPPPRRRVGQLRLQVSPRQVSYAVGERVRVRAALTDTDGEPLDRPVSWQLQPGGVARVFGQGTERSLQFVRSGRVEVTACAERVCAETVLRGLDRSGVP